MKKLLFLIFISALVYFGLKYYNNQELIPTEEKAKLPYIYFSDSIDVSSYIIRGSFFLNKTDDFETDLQVKNDYDFLGNNKKVLFDNYISFSDTLNIIPTGKVKKRDIYLSFSYKSENGMWLKWSKDSLFLGASDFKDAGIKIEKAKNGIEIVSNGITELYNPQVFTIDPIRWNNKKKKSVIVIDINNLTTDLLLDENTIIPNLSDFAKKSKFYTNVNKVTLNKEKAKVSLLTGIHPDKLPDNSSSGSYKKIIIDKIRNDFLPKVYKENNYLTYLYSNIDEVNDDYDFGFLERNLYKPDQNSDNLIFKDLSIKILENWGKEAFYYVTVNNNSSDFSKVEYLKRVDWLFSKLFETINSTESPEDFILVVTSTSSDDIDKKLPLIFYNLDGIEPIAIDNNASILDFNKTILNYSSLKIPKYYAGKNLLHYGKSYSSPVVGSSDLVFTKNGVVENSKGGIKFFNNDSVIIGDNLSDFRKKMVVSTNFDCIKNIVFKNNSNSYEDYNVEVSSEEPFILSEDIEDFYERKPWRKRYYKNIKVSLAPNEEKKVYLFFENERQKFYYKFREKVNLAYTKFALNAGSVVTYEENTYIDDDNSNYELSTNYDIKIYNQRIK